VQTKPIPIRLSPDLVARLDAVAKKIQFNRAGIVRFCLQSWLEHFEEHGEAMLPPNWKEILKAQDNRRNGGYEIPRFKHGPEMLNDAPMKGKK
jgi:predicted DNA-binding protein